MRAFWLLPFGLAPRSAAAQGMYCSDRCRLQFYRQQRGTPVRQRPALPDFAKKSGWTLRKDIERLERIVADDRFDQYRQQVTTHLRGHLEYAVEVCQDLLSRLAADRRITVQDQDIALGRGRAGDGSREWLGFNTHNRNLRQRQCSASCTSTRPDMEAGNWQWNGESIKFAEDGTLLDGQHRLAAIAESGVTLPVLVVRGLPNETQETAVDGAYEAQVPLMCSNCAVSPYPSPWPRLPVVWACGMTASAGFRAAAVTPRPTLRCCRSSKNIRGSGTSRSRHRTLPCTAGCLRRSSAFHASVAIQHARRRRHLR